MLDLDRLRRTTLSGKPKVQRFVAHVLLTPNYRIYPGVEIVLEGLDNIPNEPVFFAMNHTDAFNYWPFQYQIWQERDRYTATWVKGKNYESKWSAGFLALTNNIPIPSRGYLITRDFITVTGRRPSDDEYEVLRKLVENEEVDGAIKAVPPEVLERARDMLGRAFDPTRESYGECQRNLLREMMAAFVDLNRQAFDKKLDIIVFPEGTRSKRLSRGRPGLAQMAYALRRPVVPVGCNGCDLVYPNRKPFAHKGRIVYRFGKPVPEEIVRQHDPGPFEPFLPADEKKHKAKFQAFVDYTMDRINELLDERHRYTEDRASTGTQGTDRFV
jgi:1-acyl-sn-glycerol-3-phosphate acyltransferase